MSGVESSSQERFHRIMVDGAHAILDSDGSPYWVTMRLMGDLGQVLTEADFAGAAYEIWGWLTDAIDGPPRYSGGLSESEIDDLMRLAATEWLALDPTPEGLDQYFDRWREWPDSIWPGESQRWSDQDHLPPDIVRREAEEEMNRYHAAIQRAAASVDEGWAPYAVAQKLQEALVRLRPAGEPLPDWAGPLADLVKAWVAAPAAGRLGIERRIRQLISDLQHG